MKRAEGKKVEGYTMQLPVKEGTKISQAEMVALDKDGYAVAAAKEENLKIVGVSKTSTNSIKGQEDTVLVETGGFVFSQDGTIKETDITKDCYVADSATVTITETASSKAGKIIGVEDGCVTVLIEA